MLRLSLVAPALLVLSCGAALAWDRSSYAEEMAAGERTEESAQYIDFFALGDMVYLSQGGFSVGCAANEPLALAAMLDPEGVSLPATPVGSATVTMGQYSAGPFPVAVNEVSGVATLFLSAQPTRARWMLADMARSDEMTVSFRDGSGATLPLTATISLQGFKAAADAALKPTCPAWFAPME